MSKKFFPLIVVGIFVLSGLGAVAGTEANKEHKVIEKISFSKPIIKTQNEYVSINIAEANSYITEQGKPMLPSQVKTFTFPFGTKIKSVTCTPSNIQTQTISKDIIPTPKAVLIGTIVTNSQDVNIDYETKQYPLDWFFYDVGCGRYNGELSIIVETEVIPIKYHPADKTIDWIKNVEIEIDYELPNKKETKSSRETFELIIIGPDEYSNEIAPLITHKNDRGVSAKFVGLNEVYAGIGRDNQEKIKYYIKDAIETWETSNVILLGSWHDNNANYQKLPARKTHIVSTDPEDDEIFVSDLYYADIYNETMEFCDWDADGDSIFGEVIDDDNIDKVDLHPDIYLARIPAKDGSQVTKVVNKIKTYENNEPYLEDWFTDIVVLGGDTSPGYESLEGEYINQKVMDLMGGYSAKKMWVSNEKLTMLLPKNGVENIKDAINAGCGFVDFSGHGNTNIWATHPLDSHKWVPTISGGFLDSHISQLTNGNKLPIVAVEACSTAKFNKNDNTFNWAFLHNSNGGAIASFGATGLGWGYVGTGISQGLIGKMGLDTFRAYHYDNAETLGEMWGEALERYIKPRMEVLDYKTTEEWQSFGDPTLQIASDSNPPSRPSRPDGPESGKIGETYTFSTDTTEPDGEQIYYRWEWGDGTYSSWLGPYNSGDTITADKKWNSEGEYEVRVAAKDTNGKTSSWSSKTIVTITPKSRYKNIFLFQQFIENYPIIEKLLLLFPIFKQLLT